ncbi:MULTISPECIES: DUF969 domain-containing protein [Geobacillus]|uniref:DUF969 domain-containing protein n=1 Tax=Geobacillus TaxID=129337 RepID=UPI0004177B39|nr:MULTISPECIES: DUF969 domain-containing protein [Geobacillus]OQP17127.1 hypothetical protein B1693_04890 [Geobacillus zalihae]QNU25110.1 DUF969 domain-containing protein [Geobacillus zalihae]
MVLIGVLIVIIGFIVRINPLLVVTAAGLATGLLAHQSLYDIIEQFGTAFTTNRYMAVFIATLPVIGLLERFGLREQAESVVAKIKAATTGRILTVYLIIREAAAAAGLTSIGGHAQMVRPLVAPMAEGAAEAKYGKLPDHVRDDIRAHSAAVDNIGLFFGEDVFIAIGAILLMKGFFDQNGIPSDPLHMALWAIPTAVAALIVHSIRLHRLDRSLHKLLHRENGKGIE